MRTDLRHGAWVDYQPDWMTPDDAALSYVALKRELEWEQRSVTVYGRRIPQPRLIAWAGREPYSYSGATLEPREGTPALRYIGDLLLRSELPRFNHCLANWYRDGSDSIGMHADDEPELGRDPVVASVSFGVSRRLVVAAKKPEHGSEAARWSFDLGSGALFVMGGACQTHYFHGIPKQKTVTGERISLTFRWVGPK